MKVLFALWLSATAPEPTPPSTGDAGSTSNEAAEAEAAEAAAEEEATEAEGGETLVQVKRDLRRVVGSAHVVDNETLERFESDDVQRALRATPGVYVRDEDGVGLRPNIGLRGASSDRSAKVTLLEDGVLLTPAPYAAPAAYYFPMTTRLVGIEVFKGPAAIRTGPHTIGGALNLRTRAVPTLDIGAVDVGAGFVDAGRLTRRLHGFAGTGDDGSAHGVAWGVVVEGAHVDSDGFKRVVGDPAAPTGFVRDDLMLKARVGSPLLAEVRHSLELKLGLGHEHSSETYLGLSDEDFRRDPLARYAASANDEMQWWRTQGQLRYAFVADDLDVDVVAYRHDLDRTWNKVNRIAGASSLHDVLTLNTPRNGLLRARLNGVDVDAFNSADDTSDLSVFVGPNERTYVSQGVQGSARTTLRHVLLGGALEHRVEAGARLHHDGIVRKHSERAFVPLAFTLVDVDDDDRDDVTADNAADALALAVFVADEMRIGRVSVVPGVRVESIWGQFINRVRGGDAGGDPVMSHQLAVLPGLGVAVEPLDRVVVLAGVHRGFSPVAPGQTKDVRPEESTAVELGSRVDLRRALGLTLELTGFASLYDNIVGECTFSAGCVDDIGTQTNGGRALTTGVESAARHEVRFDDERRLRFDASYTFTHAQFLSSFTSPHPLFGDVAAGDEMAYIPAHQLAFTGAVVVDGVDVGLSAGLISAMRDVPGQGPTQAHERTDVQAVVDVVAGVDVVDNVRLTLRVDNVFDQRAIVSRRPFGARPGKPRGALLSLEASF